MPMLRQLSTMAAKSIRALESYNACDISDALLKLKVPNAGFIPNISPFAPHPPFSPQLSSLAKTIAPASTVLFVPKSPQDSNAPNSSIATDIEIPKETNIPSDKHYVDLTQPDTLVVMSQPPGQNCAMLGGIMALRMKMCSALGILVGGRIRDLRELRALDFPIYAQGTSTVGSGAESKPWAIGVPIEVGGTRVYPGDIVFADPVEGVVVIPKDKLEEVIELLPRLTQADDRVVEDVKAGSTVKDAFAKHRSNL